MSEWFYWFQFYLSVSQKKKNLSVLLIFDYFFVETLFSYVVANMVGEENDDSTLYSSREKYNFCLVN